MKYLSVLRKHSLLTLIIVILMCSCAHLMTVDISPVHWMDEIQIAEIAHGGVGSKSVDASLCLINDDGTPNKQTWALYWFGGWFHDYAYSIGGHVGPRILQLAWLAALAVLVFAYSKERTSDVLFALLLALAVYAYPPLTKSVRGGRVDAQALVFTVSSLLLAHKAGHMRPSLSRLTYFVAGACFMCAFFSWVTSILIAPLVLCEIFEELKCRRIKEAITSIGFSSCGAVFAGLLLSLPFSTHISDAISTFNNVVSLNAPHDTFSLAWADFLREVIVAPGFIAAGIVLLLLAVKKNLLVIFFLVVASFVCLATRIYVFRMIYFLPFALIGFMSARNMFSYNRRIRICLLSILGIMVFYSLICSVGVRNATEVFARPSRDYAFYKNALAKEIGTGPDISVYLDTFELGYVSRELGWNAYRVGAGVPGEGLLEKCDWIIIKRGSASPELEAFVAEMGFALKCEINGQESRQLTVMEKLLDRYNRLSPLGPYVIYSKK